MQKTAYVEVWSSYKIVAIVLLSSLETGVARTASPLTVVNPFPADPKLSHPKLSVPQMLAPS